MTPRAALLFAFPALALGQSGQVRTLFEVRYVAAEAVYLNGGSNSGLAEGFRLTVKRIAPGEPELAARTIGEIAVVSVASTSAVCEIRSRTTPFQVGDRAYLSAADIETLRMVLSSRTTRSYAQVVSFTEGDPLEEELREYVPRPPSPEVNRLRGRVSVEHNSILDRAIASSSNQIGFVVRADMTRISGTYWNLTGYWRGRLNSRRVAAQATLTDLINRTYHIGAYYNNPQSSYSAGFGRLLVPWANSLNTIDGGYLARRFRRSLTTGLFAGSTPDPTAWNYNPNRQIAGGFLNYEGGSFDGWKFTSTTGLAVTRLRWKAEREFVFFENGLFYRNALSVYHNVEADRFVAGRAGISRSGPALSRSFLTFRLQPSRVVTFDLNHNYFRGTPTADPALIGAGLLDRLLFQGVSGGVRFDLPNRISFYTTVGRNRRDGDAKASWNQMNGATYNGIWRTGIRADVRYSNFNSTFGSGSYQSLSLSRDVGEQFRLDVQVGQQDVRSPLSQNTRARFITSYFDWFLGPHYVFGGGFTAYRGQVQNYDQAAFNLGYRF